MARAYHVPVTTRRQSRRPCRKQGLPDRKPRLPSATAKQASCPDHRSVTTHLLPTKTIPRADSGPTYLPRRTQTRGRPVGRRLARGRRIQCRARFLTPVRALLTKHMEEKRLTLSMESTSTVLRARETARAETSLLSRKAPLPRTGVRGVPACRITPSRPTRTGQIHLLLQRSREQGLQTISTVHFSRAPGYDMTIL